jgi:putative ABC transport system substrate-binding protein
MAIKSLDYLMEFDPKPTRIMVVYVPAYPTNSAILKELRLYISSVNATLIELPVAGIANVESALKNIERTADADAIMLMPDFIPRTKEAVKVIINYADKHHIPVIGGPLPLLKEGILLTIDSNNRKQGELAASIADRIFNGVSAGTIPVITPEDQLFINYRKSRELGLKASRGLLRQAKEIIR